MKINEKGFAPILAFVIILGLLVSYFAVHNFSNSGDTTLKQTPNEKVEPSPSIQPEPSISIPSVEPTQPQASPTPVPSPTQTPVTHDGSRSGKIISHFDYCERKDISVYENELVKYISVTGAELYLTKDDIKCLESSLGTPGQQQKNNTDTVKECQNNVNAIFDSKMWFCGNDYNPSTCRFVATQQRLGYLSNCERN